MSRRRVPALGPTTRHLVRQAAEPIAFAASMKGAVNAGDAIVTLAAKVGPLLVLIDPADRKRAVFVVPRDSKRARLLSEQFAHWIVGVFNRDACAVDIAHAISAVTDLNAEVTT